MIRLLEVSHPMGRREHLRGVARTQQHLVAILMKKQFVYAKEFIKTVQCFTELLIKYF